jgi:diketogulonate reductase-like aldo/keto reductase
MKLLTRNDTKSQISGVEMPLLQLGTCQLVSKTGIDSTVPEPFVGLLPERAFRQVELALQNGIRAFDTALIYRSHTPLGYVLGEWWRTGQLVHRNDVWIQTKVFHPDATKMTFGISHMPSLMKMSPMEVTQLTWNHVETSLLQLNVGYIDLLLLHWPSGLRNNDLSEGDEDGVDVWSRNNSVVNRERRMAAWKVLEEVYQKGWARAIGVSNFSVKHLQQLAEDGATIVPMVNQIEASVVLQYSDIVCYCLQKSIIPQAYSPFGRCLTDIPKELLQDMAQKYEKKDFGQVAIKYLVQLGYSVVYLSNSPERMLSNLDVFDFEISTSDMGVLRQFNRVGGGWGLPSPNQLD